MRFPRASGLVSGLVLGLAAGLVVLGGEAVASERHYEDVVDITFPADGELAQTPISDGTGFVDNYHDARGNSCGIHRAIDIMGSHGDEVYAARSGEVTMARTGSHNWLRIEGDDGYRHAYLHLGRSDGPREEAFAPGIEEGAHVERGQHIGYVGSSGNASEDGPHLHFELQHEDLHDTPCRDGGWGYYNPYASLTAAMDRGDVPGWDDGDGNEGEDADGEPSEEPSDEEPPEGAGEGGAEVDRVSGPTRVATAAELAVAAFPEGSDHVVVGPAWSFPETAVAGPLAVALGGPVLTTGSEGLHPRAAEAIRELDPERVTLVGGPEVLAYEVFDDLVTQTEVHGERIDRLAGDGPAGTAAAVAAEVWERTGSEEALLARGADPDEPDAWPDALTGGWYGAVTEAPVLLTTPESVPAATAEALADVEEATIVGGTAAVSEGVEGELRERVGAVDRLSGRTRFETAASLVDALLAAERIDPDRLWAATGGDYADAVAAAPAVAAEAGALALIDGGEGEPSDGLDGWFDRHRDRFAAATVIGGTAAVSDDARRTLSYRLE